MCCAWNAFRMRSAAQIRCTVGVDQLRISRADLLLPSQEHTATASQALAARHQSSSMSLCSSANLSSWLLPPDRDSTLASLGCTLQGRDLLVSYGWLQRRRMKRDTRAYAVRLTQEGRRILALGIPIGCDGYRFDCVPADTVRVGRSPTCIYLNVATITPRQLRESF
jgi:hypothetical protein